MSGFDLICNELNRLITRIIYSPLLQPISFSRKNTAFRRTIYNVFIMIDVRRWKKMENSEAFSRCKINTQIIANAQSKSRCAYGNHLEEFSSRDCLYSLAVFDASFL
jgi:hypothetical protein